jgi:endonuclease G
MLERLTWEINPVAPTLTKRSQCHSSNADMFEPVHRDKPRESPSQKEADHYRSQLNSVIVRVHPCLGRFVKQLRWAHYSIALLLVLGLTACTTPAADAGQGFDRAVQAVLNPQDLMEGLSRVLKIPAPNNSVGQDSKTPPTASADTEPFKECAHFFAEGRSPILARQPLHRPLCFDSFAVLHSGQPKTPVFVAQRLNRQSIADASTQKRTDRFYADARLPRSERAELGDYKGSGYSRGHMAPAGDMPNPSAMAQSFSLANVVPQSERHNGGAWAKVEQDTRQFAQRAAGNVYVITGPVYSQRSAAIGFGQVHVPDHIFKLVYDEAGRRAWAHWHANQDGERAGRPISYRELVRRTGIEFLPRAGL